MKVQKLGIAIIIIGIGLMFAALYCITHEYKMYSRVFGVASLFFLILSSFVLNNQELSRKIFLQTKSVIVSILSKITLRRFLVGLILLRFVWYLYSLYFEVRAWIVYISNDMLAMIGYRVILLLFFDLLFFSIIILDSKTMFFIKVKSNKVRRFSIYYLSCMFIYFLSVIVISIINLIRLRNTGFPTKSWISLYHFSLSDLILTTILLSAIVQLIIVFKFKEKLIYRTIGFADPLYQEENNNNIELSEESEDEA